LPASVSPDDRATIRFTIPEPYPLDIRGELELVFAPDAVNNMDEPAIKFVSTGARRVSFTIAANSTEAGPMEFQTGTVAGALSVRITSTEVAGARVDLQVTPVASRVGRSAPVIRSANRVSTATGFDVVVRGYSTSRDLTQASFRFTAAPGANLQTTSLTAQLGTESTRYYTSQESLAGGGNFQLRVSFRVDGQVSSIGSVFVTLENSQGRSVEREVQ
jgi:hypothetical protein